MLHWALTYGGAWQEAKDAGVDVGSLQQGIVPHPPEIGPGLGGWYQDFWELSTERHVGMGVGPIPPHAITAHVAGWRYDDADMFRECVRAMDGVYLDKVNGDGGASNSDASARDMFRDAMKGSRSR